MTFDEWKILVKGLRSAYTSDHFLPDGDSVKIWYGLLKDLDYAICSAAIQKYISTEEMPPKVASIRRLASEIVDGRKPDWGSGWESVLKSMSKFGMYRETEALASMDEITRRCVKRLGYQNLCTSADINQDRANFRMIYTQEAENVAEERMLPEKLRGMIGVIGASDKNLLEG